MIFRVFLRAFVHLCALTLLDAAAVALARAPDHTRLRTTGDNTQAVLL
jgi:hypothetical protein